MSLRTGKLYLFLGGGALAGCDRIITLIDGSMAADLPNSVIV
jgi:hypothetical protein